MIKNGIKMKERFIKTEFADLQNKFKHNQALIDLLISQNNELENIKNTYLQKVSNKKPLSLITLPEKISESIKVSGERNVKYDKYSFYKLLNSYEDSITKFNFLLSQNRELRTVLNKYNLIQREDFYLTKEQFDNLQPTEKPTYTAAEILEEINSLFVNDFYSEGLTKDDLKLFMDEKSDIEVFIRTYIKVLNNHHLYQDFVDQETVIILLNLFDKVLKKETFIDVELFFKLFIIDNVSLISALVFLEHNSVIKLYQKHDKMFFKVNQYTFKTINPVIDQLSYSFQHNTNIMYLYQHLKTQTEKHQLVYTANLLDLNGIGISHIEEFLKILNKKELIEEFSINHIAMTNYIKLKEKFFEIE